MDIVKIIDADKIKHLDLLLIGDEQVDMIEKYLYRGEMFAVYDNELRAICVVTQEQAGVFELKNIVTVPEYQRQSYGRQLISFIAEYYKGIGNELFVGTGDSPGILNFYEKCGFEKSHILRNFFIENYDHPMFDDGIQLVDMIYLKRDL